MVTMQDVLDGVIAPEARPRQSGVRTRIAAWSVAVVAVGLTATFYVPALWRMSDMGDFPAHIRDAEYMFQTGEVIRPHPGFHLMTMAMHGAIPGIAWRQAGFAAALLSVAASALLLSMLMSAAAPGQPHTLALICAALMPAALLLANPLLPPGPLPRDPWLIGYFPANQFHNPTTMASRPLALALLLFCATFAVNRVGVAWRHVAAAAALVVASAVVKPSFLLGFLPALGLIALGCMRRVSWRVLIPGVAIPAIAVLLVQMYGRYSGIEDTAGLSMVWDPLYVIGLYSATDAVTLGTKLGASILFPLLVTVMFVKDAARSVTMRLAWLTFGCGVAWGYLMSESGGKASAGDFLWSGQIAAFVLFAIAGVFLVERLTRQSAESPGSVAAKAAVCVMVLAWHAVDGVRHFNASWL